jgi:catechol 2,3-dioxygenase-like lactoylglutathione lyase family enzyme
MRVRRLETVVQFVRHPEQAKAWYTRFLGIEPTPYVGPYFKCDEHAYLILAPCAPGTGRGGTGVWFEVEDVQESYEELRAKGFDFNEEPYDIPPGKLVTINDPDGNIVGLIDNSKGGMPGQIYDSEGATLSALTNTPGGAAVPARHQGQG